MILFVWVYMWLLREKYFYIFIRFSRIILFINMYLINGTNRSVSKILINLKIVGIFNRIL